MKLTEENWRNLKALAAVLFCLYIMSGGFFNMLIKPTQFTLWRGEWYSISPETGEQTTRESLFAFICNATTFLGLYLMAASGSNKRDRLTSNRLMILGIGLILAGMFGSYILLELKRIPWYTHR